MSTSREAITEKANPTLATVFEVEQVLEREAKEGDALPLSISEIERRLAARRTRRGTVRAAVQALVHYGVAAVGTKGVLYTRPTKRVADMPAEDLA
ncbi:MAG: hypothetical protein HYT80_05365 [Euryarchaeota archaeon]|nr:hypothetical protein [Euryarchaeota archaeon]